MRERIPLMSPAPADARAQRYGSSLRSRPGTPPARSRKTYGPAVDGAVPCLRANGPADQSLFVVVVAVVPVVPVPVPPRRLPFAGRWLRKP